MTKKENEITNLDTPFSAISAMRAYSPIRTVALMAGLEFSSHVLNAAGTGNVFGHPAKFKAFDKKELEREAERVK
jgi:hypothetical protein